MGLAFTLRMLQIVVLSLTLAGCAALTEGDCRTGNWYALGERDAMAGLPPRVDQYAAQCGPGVSAASYMDGWQVGYTEWNRRVSGSKM